MTIDGLCGHCGFARGATGCMNVCCPNGPFRGRPLHDVATWPDGRLLELAEGRASYDAYDVASMAHALLKSRREAEKRAPKGAPSMGSHIVMVDGVMTFQSDKYPSCPAGKVPLSVTDKTAQDLLWEYAQRRRALDAEFSDDLEAVLRAHGYKPAT